MKIESNSAHNVDMESLLLQRTKVSCWFSSGRLYCWLKNERDHPPPLGTPHLFRLVHINLYVLVRPSIATDMSQPNKQRHVTRMSATEVAGSMRSDSESFYQSTTTDTHTRRGYGPAPFMAQQILSSFKIMVHFQKETSKYDFIMIY